MKTLLILVIFTICSISFGQDITKTELIGKWITKDVITNFGNTTLENENRITELKKGLINSVFDFNSFGKVSVRLVSSQSNFARELAFLNNQNWKLEGNKIKIGGEENNYSFMNILVRKDNGKVYFILPGIRLEVRKS